MMATTKYKCPYCRKRFQSRKKLYRHVKRVHRIDLKAEERKAREIYEFNMVAQQYGEL